MSGCSVPWGGGGNLSLVEYPYGTEHPHGTHDIPHMYHESSTVLNYKR